MSNIEVYTKSNCSYCDMAKRILQESNIAYSEQSLNNEFLIEEFKTKYPHIKSVPAIFVDNFFIGGYNELKEWLKNADKRQIID